MFGKVNSVLDNSKGITAVRLPLIKRNQAFPC